MTAPSSSRSFEWPRAKDPAQRRAKEKAAITHPVSRSETFPFRSAFPRFPHDERVPPFFFWKVSCCACVPRLRSSSASRGVSLLQGRWNIFLAHAISYLRSCGALDVLRLRRCFAKSLMNKSKQMLYFFSPFVLAGRGKHRAPLPSLLLLWFLIILIGLCPSQLGFQPKPEPIRPPPFFFLFFFARALWTMISRPPSQIEDGFYQRNQSADTPILKDVAVWMLPRFLSEIMKVCLWLVRMRELCAKANVLP